MGRALSVVALGAAAALAAPLSRADEPVTAGATGGEGAPALAFDAAPCVSAILDVDRLAEALRIERAVPSAVEIVHLACQGAALEVALGSAAPLTLQVDDVARADRPRVVALALAEAAQSVATGSEPAAAAAPEPAADAPGAIERAPAPPARRARTSTASAAVTLREGAERRDLEPFRGWSAGAGIEAMGLPATGGGAYLLGPRLFASLWGRAVGAHAGVGTLLGEGSGQPVRLVVANARFALAGPPLGRGRLDVELGVEGGSAWSRNDEVGTTDQRWLVMLTADLVLRWPVSNRWGLSFDLGYRRAYADDISDLVALSFGVSRSVD